MAAVYLGFDPKSRGLVAIKVLHGQLVVDQGYIERFRREISILQSLDHPNVVKLIDSGEQDDLYYLVLEYIRGKSLGDILRERRRLPVEKALALIKDVAKALSHAHTREIVHRDIKPGNIMVDEVTGIAKILDFGVARASDQAFKTRAGEILGTLAYAAPEQIMGRDIDERADLYALGVVAYEAVTGQTALVGQDPVGIVQQQSTNGYTPPSECVPDLPRDLDPILLRLLKYRPDERYQTAGAFLLDLETCEKRYHSREIHSRSVYEFPEYVKQFQEASAAFEAKDHATALGLTEDLVTKTPRAPEVFFLLGRLQMERGLVYNGIQAYIKATAFDPENSFYQINLGQACLSIGMDDQAKQAFEEALRLDPESTLARQKLVELAAKGTGPTDLPIPQSSGVAQSGPEDQEPAEEPPPVDLPPEVLEGFVKTLRAARPPAPQTRGGAFRTIVWWGWGFHDLGCFRSVRWATSLQIAFIVIAGLLLPLVWVVSSNPATAGMIPARLQKDPRQIFSLIVIMYAAGSLYFVLELLAAGRLLGLQGHVIARRKVRAWRLTVDLGLDRGVAVEELLQIYREHRPGSGKGRLLGQLVVHEVTQDTCSGGYEPKDDDAPRVGDYAVSSGAIKSRLVDPDSPVPNRFLTAPNPGPAPVTAPVESPGPLARLAKR